MSSFDYQLSTLTKYRAGTVDDPYVDVSQSTKVISQRIVLNEIPVFMNKVVISGMFEKPLSNTSDLGTLEYRCDYTEGVIYFHSSQEGTTKTLVYKGRGNHFIADKRIWTQESNGNVTETLADVIVNATNLVDMGVYSSVISYKANNIVRYQGATYMCILDSLGNAPTNTTYFRKVSGYKTTGSYSSSVTYQYGDVVNDATNQVVYQSISDNNLGNSLTNATYWTPMISVATLVSNLNTAESSRVTAESSRVTAESSRVSAESSRVSTESSRVGAETIRQSQESTRQSQEAIRQTNTTAAINNANNAADTTKMNYKQPVTNYSDIATTYPTPVLGDAVQVTSTNQWYRYNGSTWQQIFNLNLTGYETTASVDSKVGILSSLATTDKSSLVNAINENVSNIGDISNCKTVSDMKVNTKIKLGSIARTFGFYTFGDGGGAEYSVVANTGRVGDDVTLFDLPNTLQAKLIHNGTAKAEQLGLKKDVNFDNAPLVVKAIAGNVKDIYFPAGVFQFNELLITYNTAQDITGTYNLGCNVRLHGANDLTFNLNGWRSTVFSPYTTNQKYIVKFGGTSTFAVPSSALDTDVSNVGLIDVAMDDQAMPTINGCLCLEYVYSSSFSVAFFNNYGRSLYIKNCWELDFKKMIIRENRTKLEAIFIDDALSDGASNTSRLYFDEVDIEGISGTFLKSSVGSNAANIMIGTLSYEHNFTHAYTNVSTPNNLTAFQGYTKIPLFDLGFMDGLSINQMNLHGMCKKYFTDGITNFTDSLFTFRSFFNVSIANININDSGAYIHLADGTGDLHSVLKINGITSSKRNRLWFDGTVPAGELLMFSSVVLGSVIIPSNSFKENDTTPFAVVGKIYAREELIKLCGASKTSYSLAYDSGSINGYVFKRVVTDFGTIARLQVTDHLKCKVRLRTDAGVLQINTLDASNATVLTQNFAVSGTNYQEIEFVVRKDSNVTAFTIVSAITGSVFYLDYLLIQPLSIVQSSTSPSITNGQTITTQAVNVARVNPSSAVTGILLQAGVYGGQEVTIINEATVANSVTFAASGTSFVADGVGTVIAGGTARKLVWDSSNSLWYRLQ